MKRLYTAIAAALAISAGAQTPDSSNLVVEEDNGTKTVFATSDLKAVVFAEMPQYAALNTLIDALYTPTPSYGMYDVTVGNAIPDVSGNPAKVGDILVTTSFTAALSENNRNALLPDGYYRVGNGSMTGTFDITKTAIYARTAEGSDGVSIVPCVDGTIDVKYIDDKYDIRFELTGFDGQLYNLSYAGTIPFDLSETGYEGFTKDLDIEFEGCQGRFYGNWYRAFADDITLQLYTGDFNADGVQIEGYWYNIYLNMPKIEGSDKKPALVDGVYTIDPRENVPNQAYMPYTVEIGYTAEALGMLMNIGTALSYTDPDGDNRVGLARSGTVTISENGSKIVVDLYTADGVRMGGTFEGACDIRNLSHNDEAPQRPFTTLDSDITVDFIPQTVGVYFIDEADAVPGFNSYTLWLTDPSQLKGDYMQFTYLSEGENGLQNGTYTVGLQPKAFDLLPGQLDYGGVPYFSWFSNLEKVDADGVQLIAAPIMEGTMLVSDADREGYKTFKFNFKDDKGNAITGEATLPVFDGDEFFANGAPRRSPLRK